MASIIDALKKQKIVFPLKYYGSNDLGTYYDLNTIADNTSLFLRLIQETDIDSLTTMENYLDYLCLRKLSNFQELLPLIKPEAETERQLIYSVTLVAEEKYRQVTADMVVLFINNHYVEIFEKQYNGFQVSAVSLDLIAKFQSQIDKDVFAYLAQNRSDLILANYDEIHQRIEQESALFSLLFPEGTLAELVTLGEHRILDIFSSILAGKQPKVKTVVETIVNQAIVDIEDIIKHLPDSDSREILEIESIFKPFFQFLQKIKHPKANVFHAYSLEIEERLGEYLQKHGQEFRQEIPVNEILALLKRAPNWEIQILQITHNVNIQACIIESRLAHPSEGKRHLSDFVSSNLLQDDYFTASHQHWLDAYLSVGGATILGIWHDQELFPNCLCWYKSILKYIGDNIGNGNTLTDDIDLFYAMLQPVILSDYKENAVLKPLCYGAAMFICAMIEKLLRSIYLHFIKDKQYVPISVATLGNLLRSDNSEIVNIFGDSHIKNLEFYLLLSGKDKIGRNLRNSLAHWVDLDKQQLNSFLVAQLFYLYTDILNTVFLYFQNFNHRISNICDGE